MYSNGILSRLGEFKIVPVVEVDNAEVSIELADALISAGLPCAEITFRTKAAAVVLDKISRERKEILSGAGTVLKVDQVREACDSGADFIVTPGFNPKVVDYCLKNNITVIPGTSNPTDIEMALDFNLNVVKFFPAESFGGIKTLKAISAPYPMMRFIPTGGINIKNCMDYLALPNVLAVGGSWMVGKTLLNKGKFKEIILLIKETVILVHG